MRLLSQALLLSSLLITPAAALSERAFLVAGERYAPAFDHTSQDQEHFIEFTRSGETVKTWTKLFVLHAFMADRRAPKDAAMALAHLAESRYRSAATRVLENAEGTEAIVVFLATATDPADDTIEVDAVRYARSADGKSLISAQFSSRFTLGEVDAEEIRGARTHATEGVAKLPIEEIRAYLVPTT